MRIFEQGVDDYSEIRTALTSGSPADSPTIENTVKDIISDVISRGDNALLELTRKFDSPEIKSVKVDQSEIRDACRNIPSELYSALENAASKIRVFHEAEKQQSWFTTESGVTLGQLVKPIDSVGIYVPGGRAAYPSSVLMTAIPASVAGVPDICVATPPSRDGRIVPGVLAACYLCGVSKVYKMGGAQAIAAMAYGTATVTPVDKIVGPGNQYVNIAKRLVYGKCGIDSLAGPSEVLIIADNSAKPDWVAIDLIAQAEHGEESKSILITTSRVLADRVLTKISVLTETMQRKDYIRQALAKNGVVLAVDSLDEAVEWTNISAPEHLQLMVDNPQEILSKIKNAGAIFVGPYSPVPLGDYIAGPSHTLPTGTSARFSSALGVAEFQKRSSLIWYSKTGMFSDAQSARRIAEYEGLNAHADAISFRLEDS